jgi:ribokinase
VGTVCVVGSANLDLVARVAHHPRPGETVLATDFQTHPGGKGRNQAVAAARAGAAVTFVGCVGDDPEGAAMRASLTAEGVGVDGLSTVSAPTGRAFISVAADGDNAIVVVSGANGSVSAPSMQAARAELARAPVVLAQLEIADTAVASAFTFARADGSTTILNAAPARPVPTLLGLTDVLVVNEHEAGLLAGTTVADAAAAEAAAQTLLGTGPATVVVTLGAAGAIAVRAEGTVRQAVYPAEVVDTTGAGDAACGALAAALAGGMDMAAALARACAAGALAVSQLGASPPALTGEAIGRLVSGGA